jgi:hypothetical protein
MVLDAVDARICHVLRSSWFAPLMSFCSYELDSSELENKLSVLCCVHMLHLCRDDYASFKQLSSVMMMMVVVPPLLPSRENPNSSCVQDLGVRFMAHHPIRRCRKL